MENNKFSRKIFAILLERAKGDRSWRQFSIDCNISYVQMRKLAQCLQENPPRPKLIKKVAANSLGDVEIEDLMFAAGIAQNEGRIKSKLPAGKGGMNAYMTLPLKDRRAVDSYVDYLSACSEAKKKERAEKREQRAAQREAARGENK